jgi:hypothetical protein
MEQKKMSRSEAGRMGSDKTHKRRYEILKELSKLVDKHLQNFLLGWPTKHLETLLKAYKNDK